MSGIGNDVDLQWVLNIWRLLRGGDTTEAEGALRIIAPELKENPYVLVGESLVDHHKGRYKDALEVVDRAVELGRYLKNYPLVGLALSRRAEALRMLARYDESLVAAEEALTVSRALGDRQGEANALWSKADALRMLDRCDESLVAAEEALTVYRALGSKLGEANALATIARIQAVLGQKPKKARTIDQLKAIGRCAFLDPAKELMFPCQEEAEQKSYPSTPIIAI